LKPKLTAALALLAALAIAAGFVLEGRILIMTWLILGVFALRTVLWSIRQDLD
jgi:hypothetical protein